MRELGGNAIDAACAAAWALGVCEPAESGLGGQTTALVRRADGRVTILDGHSHAPAGATKKAISKSAQAHGLRSCTVPSTPATLGALQAQFGRLTLRDVLAPAIQIARDGYPITELQRRLQRWCRGALIKFGGAQHFLRSEGRAYRVGEAFRQPALAITLERLASDGVGDFYHGRLAREIAQDMQARRGLISEADLASLSLPVERRPLWSTFAGHQIATAPPPGGGVQLLLALGVLESLQESWTSPDLAPVAATLAALAALRERERWPDHPDDLTPSLERWLVSTARAQQVARRLHQQPISSEAPQHQPPDSLGERGNTTHLCACDREGNVVSLTQSIQSVFGSKAAHPTLGFLYNNYLSACPRRSSHPYHLRPGALPQSNAAPTLVLDPNGSPRLAIGSAGSRRITTSLVHVLAATLQRGESIEGAIAAPRAHARATGKVWIEESLAVGPALRGFDRTFKAVQMLTNRHYKLGAVQAIAWDSSGRATGVADPRRDGASVHARLAN